MSTDRPKVLLVPPDTRPPTLDFPATLARAVGWQLGVPPDAALPNLNEPGDYGSLERWLKAHVADSDILILCLETLCLGGMIPARRVGDSLESAMHKLELLTTLKRTKPELKLYAFGVVVRVAHDNDPLEEKPYYGEHGAALRTYSEAFDRHERHATNETREALKAAQAALSPTILDDWLATRQRNHALHLRALELVGEGVIDHLCLTLDDTSTYGLAAHDRRALEAKTDALGLWFKVNIYPGADEVPATLLARALQAKRGPISVYVRYSGTLGPAAELLYEDRPAAELVKAQLRAAGCKTVTTLGETDAVLAVNTPGSRQGSRQPDYASVDTAARHLPDFVDFVSHCPKPVAVADIAYANGAERRLLTLLQARTSLADLAGFSAWNTAGNSLGGAIAMLVTSQHVKDRGAWLEVLFNRLVDDALYQGELRGEIAQELGEVDPFDLGDGVAEAERLLEAKVRPRAEALWAANFASTGYSLNWRKPSLAWPRLFTGVFPFTVTLDEAK